VDALELPGSIPDRRHAWHLYIVGVAPGRSALGRDQLIERLSREGVGTSVHFIPVHYHPYYGRRLGYRRGAFPRAESAFERALSLPLYPAMTDDDVDHVAEVVCRALNA
jgi:dTDP-4-amino-4,6-dideoxygalactose transaminase